MTRARAGGKTRPVKEHVTVRPPGGSVVSIELEVSLDDDDRDIALRLARQFIPGTILGIAGSTWVVQEGGQVLQGAERRPSSPPESERPPPPSERAERPEGLAPGQVWRPKDPRRKSGFRIKAIVGDTVVGEDGRTVAVDRMHRYRLVEGVE